MPEVKNIQGQRFGKLVVLRHMGQNNHRKATWECVCDCGKTIITVGGALRSGNTTSCGCHQKSTRKTHGLSRIGCREYRIWACMLSRCRNPRDWGYHNYGGRGIKVCERWERFDNFLADMGPAPSPTHSIDRYPDNDGNYEPGNCRWATKHEQDTNRRQTRLLTMNGETLCVKDWARKFNIDYDMLLRRIARGTALEVAVAIAKRKEDAR